MSKSCFIPLSRRQQGRRRGQDHPSRSRRAKGMTLLEIMVTMAIFAFIFLFMSRMFRAYVKRQEKISRRAELSRVNENVFDVLKRDLESALFFYDIHAHFPSLYPVLEEDEEEIAAADEEASSERAAPFNFMDPRFDFIGKGDRLQFTAVVRKPSHSAAPPPAALARIDYFLRPCVIFKTGEESRCLARSVNFRWKDWDDDHENSVSANMIAGVKSLKLSYFEEGEWRREWSFSNRWKAASKNPGAKAALLPAFVRAEMERESLTQEGRRFQMSRDFAVSHFLTRSHDPGELSPLAFLNIRKDRSSEKEEQEKALREEQERLRNQGPPDQPEGRGGRDDVTPHFLSGNRPGNQPPLPPPPR